LEGKDVAATDLTVQVAEPFSLVLIGFLIQQGLGLGKDAIAGYVEGLQERGQRTYSGQLLLPRDRAVKGGCLLLVRADFPEGGDIPSNFGMALLAKLEPVKFDAATGAAQTGAPSGSSTAQEGQSGASAPTTATPAEVAPDAARLHILYAKLNNAVAVTGKGKPVHVSVAVVGRAVRAEKGVPKIELFARDTVTLGPLPLPNTDDNATARKAKKEAIVQASTGLLPMPPYDASAVEITIGITESGSGVPDAKKAKAELEALEKALGPELIKAGQGLVGQE
jgi:hypothetical protein